MTPLYSVAEIRDIEQAAAAGLAPGTLMERAGRAAAAIAHGLIGALRDARVLVMAGPGNNGGDALEVAANLADAGHDVSVLHFAGSTPPSFETARAHARASASTAQFIDSLGESPWQLVVDGLFGIGLARALDGDIAALVATVNSFACPVLALDVPSGLDADTGAVVGANGLAVRASHTITFIGDKPGLHTCEGCELAGKVQVAALEIDAAHFKAAHAHLNEIALFKAHLYKRGLNAHKGSFGNVAIMGGAAGMAGAPVLAARAALLTGAGRVYVATLAAPPPYDPQHPELMLRSAIQYEMTGATLVLGPGMGQASEAAHLLAKAIGSDSPLVLDADALNLLARDAALQASVAARSAACILTPHPLEAARLLGVTSAVVQADRLAAARELALRLDATVVLKGAGTVIAGPGGGVIINPTGNPGLATAGTGDVLAGMCGSLLAQGWPGYEAALCAVWMHGAAADRLVDAGIGPIGLCASELPGAARTVFNELVYGPPTPSGRRQS